LQGKHLRNFLALFLICFNLELLTGGVVQCGSGYWSDFKIYEKSNRTKNLPKTAQEHFQKAGNQVYLVNFG
jgi:hypothetical protein